MRNPPVVRPYCNPYRIRTYTNRTKVYCATITLMSRLDTDRLSGRSHFLTAAVGRGDFLAAVAVQAAEVGKVQRRAVVVVPQAAEEGMESEAVERTEAAELVAVHTDAQPSMPQYY